MNDRQKVVMQTPCCFDAEYTVRNTVRSYFSPAAVDCDGKCATCGFNPLEQARRLETGVFCKHGRIRTLHYFRKDE